MRVIDVEEGCVVMAPPHCKYASLSYVWGKPSNQDLSARTENITNLEKKGYLFKNLPTATIHDAMVACAKLGLRYLWTDRLCILQDAVQDKHTQVNAMDVIYSCSVVTLVALAGVDAHYGLPGVHMRKRTPRPILETQGLYLIRELETYTKACDRARWTSRGWTFQEAVLSPRLLYFTNDGVYFECCHDPFVKDENAFLHPNVTRDRCKGQFNLSSSNDLVKQYTQRSLTYKTGILNAFSGILNAKYGPYHHFGISLQKFDKEILWQYGPGAHIPRTPPSGGIFPIMGVVHDGSSNRVFLPGLCQFECSTTSSLGAR
ncbi:heterokaryon incompatibility protein-domain-containing protein [Aspergillus parasiticus]|uniref:Heterokaryon incompatibility protein-domain-containing protein n=1 Tax=Aspergillus parasiticus TaxID=5067 RepID=A0A5N6DT92_ASPPA|nr:heterokaryon incompatibility protein-domain-containing protein [Aspergillus parasiticus]